MTLMLAACDEKPARTQAVILPTARVGLADGRELELEVADEERERAAGLMFRPKMPADAGMLFVFREEAERAFFMKNTEIPLDIVFLNRSGTVVSIKQMKAFDLRSTPSRAPAMYAIELNAGAAERLGIRVGDKLKMPPVTGK